MNFHDIILIDIVGKGGIVHRVIYKNNIGDLMRNDVEVDAKKVYKRKMFVRLVTIVFLALLLLLSVIYLFLYIVYDGGRFTVSLDRNLSNRKNIYLSEDGDFKNKRLKLSAETIDYMDNISIKWLPENLDKGTGSHNGNNYIAYSFYLVNSGHETVNYWYEIDVDDTIRRVDDAIRIMIFQNGKQTVYAKKNRTTKKPEPDTVAFKSDSVIVLKQRKKFKANSKDRYTIVIWLEGDDPECKNDLLGGEIKFHMDFTEEHLS